MATDTDLATHVREQLRPFLNRRIEFEGTVGKASSVYDHKAKREVPTRLMNNLEIREGDHQVIDHAWLTWATMLEQTGVRPGDVIRFTAQVYSYQHRDADDHNKFTTRLGVREPRDITCMNRELTKPVDLNGNGPLIGVRIPQLSDDIEDEGDAMDESEIPPPLSMNPPTDPKRRLLDAVWALVTEHGAAKVKKTLAAVETLMNDE
jgi:hypothetical protein